MEVTPNSHVNTASRTSERPTVVTGWWLLIKPVLHYYELALFFILTFV